MVKTKVLNYLKTQKDGMVAELQQKVEELQASNDMWKQRVKDLEKQILDVTVLQQRHEKRKAKTAALRVSMQSGHLDQNCNETYQIICQILTFQLGFIVLFMQQITTVNVGVQVDSQRVSGFSM